MTSRPAAAPRTPGRPSLAVTGVALPALALVIYLLHGFYVGLRAQHEAYARDELAHTQALGTALDHFLAGARTEVTELADRREVSAYFENAALGLSLEYGLRISLLDLETEFDKRLARRLAGGAPMFARLVLLDREGNVVLDSREPRRDPGYAFTDGWTSPAADTTAVASYQADTDQVVLAAPCHVLDRREGWLLACVPTATLLAQVSDARVWLRWDGAAMSGEAPSAIVGDVTPGTTRLFSGSDSGRHPYLASAATAAHFPLTVTRLSTVDGMLATDPRRFLGGLGVLAAGVMGLVAMVWRGQLRARGLAARLDIEAAHRRDLAARQRELEQEIERRLHVEADLVQARDVAEAASRAKTQFLANMSHELRTPLNGVLGMTELVLESALAAEQREQLGVALESGYALLAVISDILDVSNIEAGALRLEHAAFEPRPFLDNIRRSLLAGAQARGLDLAWRVDPDLALTLRGDAARLRQVLVNLLGNALKFTEHGTVGLQVTAVPVGGTRQLVTFRVHDTGIGVPPDKRDLIFGAFQQADNSHTRRYGGTGLGLHISRRLVAMMGGRLELADAEGGGSVFTFSLEMPIVLAAPAPAPAPVAPTATVTPRRLLVAEDNEVNQKLIVSLLKKWGHTVTLTADGAEALAALHAGTFDAALLDLQMPQMDGLEAATAWRRHEADRGLPRLPIIALTARVLPEDIEACFAAGMDAHVPKPLKSREVMETLERVAPAPVAAA